ncbi:MAG TPA: glycosyltransferase, partial [Acidobacteriaceae bacterium]|nr:glycosyltransferase [Acidobacteriaceae bacterium]
MKILLDFVLGVGLFGIATSSVYSALALLAIRRFRRRQGFCAAFEPPVSLLKPLHGAEPDLEAHLATFFQQQYPRYEILFCARQPEDPGLIAARNVALRFPDVPVQFLSSGEPTVPNAKILSLQRMAEAARYDVLIISDSDVRVDSNYVRDVVAPFADAAVGAVTCLYRG